MTPERPEVIAQRDAIGIHARRLFGGFRIECSRNANGMLLVRDSVRLDTL